MPVVAYGRMRGLRLWLLAVVAIGSGACRGSIDGGGGIDVGSALVDLSFAPADPREGALDSRLDGIQPMAASSAPVAVSVTAAFWGFQDMRFGTSQDCETGDGSPTRISEQTVPFDSVVIWPSGVVVPPAYDLEITGVELCYVQLTFARSAKYETFVVNAQLANGARAVYVSDHPFIVRAHLSPAVALPDLGEYSLAVSVETTGWFEGADTWSLLGGDYYWSGGREEEERVRLNIVQGMRASLHQVVQSQFGSRTTDTAMVLTDHSYDIAIDP